MEFNKDAFCYDQEQQQQQQMIQGTFLFSASSSSSASPSSTSSLSHHHHQRNLREAQIYGTSHQSLGGGWGGHGSNSYNRFVRTSSSHHQSADQSSMSCYDDIVVPMENDQNKDVDLEEKNQSLTLAHQQRVEEIEKEHMFDKVVTPSDVGKLNRLVIPKQHAEKYFPLDSSTNEKGLLLNFEDRSGKPWRFRYSYWNSSQSYVMTKGWSRFVKEKKLDAGDIVSFQRGIGELGKDRLYIDWRRRPYAAPPPDHSSLGLHNHFPFTRTMPWTTPLFMRQPAGSPAGGSAVVAPMFRDHHSSHLPHHHHHQIPPPTNSINFHYNASTNGDSHINFNRLPMTSEMPLLYYRSSPQEIGMLHLHQPHYHNQDHGGVGGIGGVEVEPMVLGSVPVVHGKAAAKRLRLFGVNMDCPISSEECEIFSSTTVPPGGAVVIPSPHHHHHYNHPQQQQQPSPSSSSSSLAQFQLQRFYNGTPVPNKGKGSLSLDLDI